MIEEGHDDVSCIPTSIAEKVSMLSIDSPFDFTAYEEGAPFHPSWPAMHSAASSASLWLAVVTNLTPAQLAQARLTDYAVAYARTVAGVHYPYDNVGGLNMGQEIIARNLPGYLNKQYGSDMEKVRAKLERYRFDWSEFSTEVGCE